MRQFSERSYRADEGKTIVRKADGFDMGESIYLGEEDSIDNYEEREVTETIVEE